MVRGQCRTHPPAQWQPSNQTADSGQGGGDPAVLIYFTGGQTSWFVKSWYGAASAGAISGGVGAAANGGNVLRGILVGGISGGAFYGIASAGDFYSSNFGSYAGVAKSASYGFVGGAMSELQGGKFGHGFISAGLGGVGAQTVGSALDGLIGDELVRRVVASAVVGGTLSSVTGGKFMNGARTMAFLCLLKEAPGFYQRTVGYDLDAGPGGVSVEKGLQGMPVQGANNIGTQRRWVYDGSGQREIGFFEEGGSVSNFANQIPGINAVAGMHDVQQVAMGSSILRDVLNVPGMVVAASVTYAGFVGQALNAAPDYLYVPIQINDNDRKSRCMWLPVGGY